MKIVDDNMLEKTEELIKKIGVKHNCYCKFTIQNNHKGGKEDYGNVSYQSYISNDIAPCHKRHESLKQVNKRFTNFLEKKFDKKERIKECIINLSDDIDCKIDELKGLEIELKEYE